jgi:hypothetical protein
MDDKKVSLGCGTILLIALLSALFISSMIGDLEDEVEHLRKDVRHLRREQESRLRAVETAVHNVQSTVSAVHSLLWKMQGGEAEPEREEKK